MKHFEIKIFGRVQGINFRWETKRKARSLNIFGFVRNEPDGSVYIKAEGREGDLDKFVAWCRKGPWLSKIERVDVVEGQMSGYTDFEIKY